MENWVMWLTIVGTNIASTVGVYKYFTSRISKVYERFDIHKRLMEDTFVRKDICKLMHEQSYQNFTGLEQRMNARLDKLEEKFDSLIKILTERK